MTPDQAIQIIHLLELISRHLLITNIFLGVVMILMVRACLK